MYQILKPDFKLKDTRGKLVQLVHEGYKQVNVIISNPGVLRGNHYHKQCKEAFYIVNGKVDVILEKEGEVQKKRFNEGDFFVIAPFTVHSMSYPEQCIMVALYDETIERENGEKDIFQVYRDSET